MASSIFHRRARCNKCQQSSDELSELPCDHCLCYSCCVTAVNVQTKKILDKTGSRPKRKSLPCPVCDNNTWLPEGGISGLPLYDGVCDSMSTLSLATSTSQGGATGGRTTSTSQGGATGGRTTSTSQGGAKGGGLQLKEAKLLWNITDHKHIWDVAFMEDGSIYYIAAKGTRKAEGGGVILDNKDLYRLGIDGKQGTLPFPFSFTDPWGVACDVTTKSVAVSYCPDGQWSVSIYSQTSGHWSCTTLNPDRGIGNLALTPSGHVVGVRPEHMVKLTSEGRAVWCKPLPGGNTLAPYVAVDKAEIIIVSTPNNHRVSVWNKDGVMLKEFPKEFIKQPEGVCVMSNGNVIVADLNIKNISMLTIDGQFIQTLVTCKGAPHSISLYNDRYLVVGTHNNGMYLYELFWK